MKGSMPEIETDPEGAIRFPERRRRRVVLPAPFAIVSQTIEKAPPIEVMDDSPPISNVRLPGGRFRNTSFSPEEPSGNA